MTPAHVHLVLNHAPVVGMPLAALLLVAGIARKSRELQVAALMGIVLVALATVPVFLTGEPAEKQIEHAAGVSEKTIGAHEDAAKWALGATELAGLIALATLMRSRGLRLAGGLTLLALFAAALAISTLARTAYLGGHIRHPEIVPGAVGGPKEPSPD